MFVDVVIAITVTATFCIVAGFGVTLSPTALEKLP